MNFSLDKSNYELSPVKFLVDSSLGEHIHEPFPSTSFFWMICGKAGSGKTSLLINSLKSKGENRIYNKVFDKITLVMPKNSRASIKDSPLDDLPTDQVFEEFDENVLKKIKDIRENFDELDKKKKRPRHQLLILDDVTSSLKNNNIMKMLIELSTNRRHLKLSIILLVQFLRAVPRPVRFQVTHVTFFKPSNNLDAKIIEEEYANMKPDEFKELSHFVFENKHDFLMINKDTETYYKNLNKININ
jgi:hypothetical protein